MTAIDWSAYRRPWNLIGPEFAAEVAAIVNGEEYAPPSSQVARRNRSGQAALYDLPPELKCSSPVKPPPAPPTLGERVKAYRQSHGLSQMRFAELVGCSGALISTIETSGVGGRLYLEKIEAVLHSEATA